MEDQAKILSKSFRVYSQIRRLFEIAYRVSTKALNAQKVMKVHMKFRDTLSKSPRPI